MSSLEVFPHLSNTFDSLLRWRIVWLLLFVDIFFYCGHCSSDLFNGSLVNVFLSLCGYIVTQLHHSSMRMFGVCVDVWPGLHKFKVLVEGWDCLKVRALVRIRGYGIRYGYTKTHAAEGHHQILLLLPGGDLIGLYSSHLQLLLLCGSFCLHFCLW